MQVLEALAPRAEMAEMRILTQAMGELQVLLLVMQLSKAGQASLRDQGEREGWPNF
jgi:energy-converting hydrogenase A subunit M